MIDYSKILQDIAERRILLYCSYKLERNSLLSGLVRHHPFYRSKGYIPFTPSNHDSTKDIYDYCIVCTKEEHTVLEGLSRIIYGIREKLTEYELNKLKDILPNSIEVNRLIEENTFYQARYSIIKQLKIKGKVWFGGRITSEMNIAWNKIKWKNQTYRATMTNTCKNLNTKQWSDKAHIEYISQCTQNQWSKDRKTMLEYAKNGLEKANKYWKTHDRIWTNTMRESVAKAQLGRRVYNNGKECRRFLPEEVPEGWILWFLPRNRSINS